MFTLHCTQKLRDRIKADFVSPSLSDTLLGNWYATAIFWKPQVALLVSERTLLPVVGSGKYVGAALPHTIGTGAEGAWDRRRCHLA